MVIRGVLGMRARDIMTEAVQTVRETDMIEDAAGLLAKYGITAAPVLDRSGALVGIVSEADLLWRRVPAAPGARPGRTATTAPQRPKVVADVMSPNPLTTTPLTDVADIANDMIHHDVRSVPVLDHRGDLVGIISRRDIVRSVIRTDEALAQEVQHRLDAYGGGVRRWRVSVSDATATIDGPFDDETERTMVGVMARTVPGIAAVHMTEQAPPPLPDDLSPEGLADE